jgi:hypothetical protein
MDNGLLFPYRCCGGRGGTRKGRLSVPKGHGASVTSGDAGAGKSTLDVKRNVMGSYEETQDDSVQAQFVQKSFAAVEAVAPVPQTDSGRWG